MDARKRKFQEKTNLPNNDLNQTISAAEARANFEYWSVFQNMFREQSARILQRWWRTINDLKPPKKYKETLTNNANLFRFIHEPKDPTKAIEHATQISLGNWTSLDFSDPEFERNIYKALRLGKINRYQLATALFIYNAQIELENPIKQYNASHNGPLSGCHISYQTSDNLKSFQEKLLEIPEKDRCYFTVNFSKVRETLFFSAILRNPIPKFYPMLKSYISQLQVNEEEKKRYLAAVNELIETGKPQPELLSLLYNKSFKESLGYGIRQLESGDYSVIVPDSRLKKMRLDHCSQRLLNALHSFDNQLPMVTLSPDFDATNPNSPIFCIIIPSIPVFLALSESMHGEEHTTDPFFTAGKIPTRLFRHLDENPHDFGQRRASRPVELSHPDLISHENPHEVGKTNKFILGWHDISHCWQNGMTTDKANLRYLTNLIEEETGYDMSKAIWFLADKDLDVYRLLRQSVSLYNSSDLGFCKTIATGYILGNIGINFWENPSENDFNLLFIIDMIKNHPRWAKEFLPNLAPEDAFKMDGENTWQGAKYIFPPKNKRNFYNRDLSNFNETFSTLKNIIHINNDKSYSRTFYVLLYRLKDHPQALNLCQELNNIGLKKFVTWQRNGGLILADDKTKMEITKLSVNQLYDMLLARLEEVKSLNEDTIRPKIY